MRTERDVLVGLGVSAFRVREIAVIVLVALESNVVSRRTLGLSPGHHSRPPRPRVRTTFRTLHLQSFESQAVV